MECIFLPLRMKSRLILKTGIVLIALLSQSFTVFNENNLAYQLEVKIHGEDVQSALNQLYDRFDFCEEQLSKSVFDRALKGYIYLRQLGELENPQYLTIVDFSLSSKKKRLWLLDMQNKVVLMNELVAHGRNSGDEFAKWFSNSFQSKQSSLGFYVTAETYNGKHRFSLKLRGLESGFNTNAFARGIVIHGANYVDESFIDKGQRIGRSFGCPAVSQKVNTELVNTIKEGTCLFIHYPDKRYLSRSKILNNDLYIPMELLKQLQE